MTLLDKGLPQEYHGGLGFACGALFAVRSPLLSYSPLFGRALFLSAENSHRLQL